MLIKKAQRKEHPLIAFTRSKLKYKMKINNGNLREGRVGNVFIIPEKFQFKLETDDNGKDEVWITFSSRIDTYKYLVVRLGLIAQILEEDFSNPKNPF